MKLLNKDSKQDIKKLCTNISKVIEHGEKMAKQLEEGKNILNKSSNQEQTINSATQEEIKIKENVEIMKTRQFLQNEGDANQDSSVLNSSDVKREVTANGNSSLETNILFNGQLVNGNISQESEVRDDRPLYFGVRSYLHNFYDPPDKEVMNSGEFSQDDFLIEPTKRNYKDCLLHTVLWIGINLTLIGITVLLVGHLVPARNTVVAYQDNIQLLDHSAIAFNRHLELCRFVGFVIICIGSMVIMIMFFVSKKYSKKEPTYYYVLGATIVPEMFIGNPLVGSQRRINRTIISVRNAINKSKQ